MIRVGIVGFGRAAREHLDAYRLFPQRCEVVAIVDPDDHAFQNADEFTLSVPRYRSLEELLQRQSVDLISLTTPPSQHFGQAVTAMRQGVHVLCETPLALSQHDIRELIEERDKHRVILSMVSQLRFQNNVQQLRMVVRRHLLGLPLFSRVDSYWWRTANFYGKGWRAGQDGVKLAQTSLYLDLINWLFGTPKSVTASFEAVAHDNICLATLHYPSGIVQFTNTSLAHGERHRVEVHCERGMLSSRGDVCITTSSATGHPAGRDGAREAEVLSLMSGVPALKHQFHPGQIDNILDVLENETSELAVSAEDALRMLSLFDAIQRSAGQQRPVAIRDDQGQVAEQQPLK